MSETFQSDSQPIGLTPERPWPGLASYTESDTKFFFGREVESVELDRLVRAEPLAVLFGTSGLGKTSLFKAGLVPRLVEVGWLPIPVRLHFDFAHGALPLTTQILEAAKHCARKQGLVVPLWYERDTLWEAFHRRGQLFWGEAPDPATPVLILDQFEECFSLGAADPATRQATNKFFAELSDLVNNRPPWSDSVEPAEAGAFTSEQVPFRVVLGLREDYLADLESLRTLLPGLRRARLRLLPFTAAQARQVVERPGAHILGPGSADAILQTFIPAGADPIETEADPALLSLFCWQLNEQRLAAQLDHLEAEGIAGSRDRILREFYASAFVGLKNSEAIERWVEDSLVDAGGYRSSRSWDDALAKDRTRPDLELLIQRRLLHSVHRPGLRTHLELTHDRLGDVAVEKRKAGQDAKAKAEVEARADAEAAAAADLRLRLRRTTLIATVMAVLFAVAIGAILGVCLLRQAARTSASKAHVSLARDSLAAGDDVQSMAHLVQALRLDPSNKSAKTLTAALLDQGSWAVLIGAPMRHGDKVNSAQFSPDGKCVMTGSWDHTARIWDATTGQAISVLSGHDQTVNSAQFSRDGKQVVTASADHTARTWDAATGKPIGQPMRHDQAVNSAQFNRDGKRVVTASADHTARVWEAATGQSICQLTGHMKNVNTAQFSPDGQWVVTASEDGTARVWDATTGQAAGEKTMVHKDCVYSAQFSPDGRRVVTASLDKTAQVWDWATGKTIGNEMPSGGWVYSAEFSSDGQRVVTASEDNTARVWDATTGNPIGEPMRHDYEVHSAHFSPDGQRVVTASSDKTARIWDAATGKPIGEPMRHDQFVRSAQFSPDGRRVVTASWDKTAKVWEATTNEAIAEAMRHDYSVKFARFSTDGTRVVTISGQEREKEKPPVWEARVWEASTGKAIGKPVPFGDNVNSVRFSPDGERVVTASNDSTAQVWNAVTGEPIGRPMQHDRAVQSAEFGPLGRRVVTASSDHTARIWDAATGDEVGKPLEHEEGLKFARFSPDGEYVVTACEDTKGQGFAAQIWDAVTGERIGHPMRHDKAIRSAEFDPFSRRLVTASDDHTAQVWDVATGKAIGNAMLHDQKVNSAQFSPDGRRIVTASLDHTARIWDAPTGYEIGMPMRHDEGVISAQFSPDGKRIVTASWDDTARVWDAATGETLGQPLRHKYSVNSAEFSPDSQRVVTASGDNTAQAWDLPEVGDWDPQDDVPLLADLAEAACGSVLQPSSQAEILIVIPPGQASATWGKILANFKGQFSALTPVERLLVWRVSDPRSRTISPFSEQKVSEWIENRIEEGTWDSVRPAIQRDPADAHLLAHFGLVLAELVITSETSFDCRRARAEAEYETRLAAALAPDNQEIKGIQTKVVTFLNRSPEQ